MYTSIRTHSHFSLLASSAKAERIAQTCVKLGQKSCVLTDYNNLSGAISFGRELGKVGVKPIYGVRILTPTMRYVSLIAKNLQGWKQLISLVSYANEQKNIISYKPTLTVDEIIEAMKPGNLILTFGGIDSSQENDSVARLLSSVSHENIFLEIESPADKMTSHLRSLPLRRVAAKPVFYATRKDAIEHRVLLASNEKSTIEKINRERMRGTSTWMDRFFAEDIYNLSSINELKELGFLDDEISNTQIIDEMCESYKITNRPSLPKFDCPNGMDEDAYIRQLCRDGWKQKRLKSWDEKTYVDRINKELGVISEASLPGYFLIVRDFINYAKDNGWLVGPGRGCFLPDTLVKMADLSYKSISLIKNGDVVIDAYGQNQEVYNTFTYDINEEILELEFENGKIVKCTKDHKFLTNRGWVEAQHLTEDDDIVEV